MLKLKKTSRKKIIFYFIIIIFMLVGNLFIYWSNARPSEIDMDNEFLAVGGGEAVTGIDDSQKQTILEHNLFTALVKIGDWPVVPRNVGKADPFVPFFGD